MRAQVIILAGPSGAGKSRLAGRLGLPVLRLDDYYKDGDDPSLPTIREGANAGLIDWDDPRAWVADDALAAIESLCRHGAAQVPNYEISQNGRCGWREVTLGDAPLFVAEGLFAQDIIASCRERGLLAEAFCVRQNPLLTFWRRLVRDLRERRKPPLVLVRRGWVLLHEQAGVVADAVAKGCRAATPREAEAAITARLRATDVGR